MAAARAPGSLDSLVASPHSQSTPAYRSKRPRADGKQQPQQPPPPSTTILLPPSLLHIPAPYTTTPTTHTTPHTTHPSHTPPAIQQLSADLLLFPAPAAVEGVVVGGGSAGLEVVVVGGPVRWTGVRGRVGGLDVAGRLPRDVVTQVYRAALTTTPSTALTQSTLITAPPVPAHIPASSASSTTLSVEQLSRATKRLRNERRALMAGMARDMRVVSACVRGNSGAGSGVMDAKEREVGNSASTMLESAVRRLGEVNDRLTLLAAVIQHQQAEDT